MILYEHPDDFIERWHEAERRRELRNQLLRALRGATPPFATETERKLSLAMREAASFSGR